jgi:hypothetical protein
LLLGRPSISNPSPHKNDSFPSQSLILIHL